MEMKAGLAASTATIFPSMNQSCRSRGEQCKPGPSRFQHRDEAAITSADVVFIAVGTPSRRGDGYADLSYVYAATAEIARELGFTVVVTKSTVPVGTGDEVERIIQRKPAR